MQGATHLLRLQVVVCNNGCQGGRLHWHVEFGTLRLYATGGVAGMSNICMARTSNGGTSTLGVQCEHVGFVEFRHQEQRDVDLRQSAQSFRPCHSGEFDI